MSTDPLESLDPELSALLDSERKAEAPADALGRVWSRVVAVPSGGGGGKGGNGPGNRWLATHAASVAAAAFVAGSAAGVAVYASLEKPPPERIVYVERPQAPPAHSTQAAPLERWNPMPAPSAPPMVTAPPMPLATSSTSTSLSAERALIDHARGELASGNPTRALELLNEHAQRFPKAQLGEEREALVIQSLVALGRYDEARAAAARFDAASPGSLFLPAIEASLGSIP